MWPWKKRKPETTEDEKQILPLTRTMGIVYQPPTPRPEPKKKPDEKPQDGDEGTIGQARAVSGGMEHNDSPRKPSFDPSRADASTLIPLQSVQIAKPCRADWDKMEGDDKSRFCQTCQKSVYNLSAMTASDAEKLLAEKNGDLCARIYRRADGTVITGDCPVGQREARRPFWWLSAGFAALMGLGAMLSGGASGATTIAPDASPAPANWSAKMRSVPLVGAVIDKISPQSAMTGAVAFEPMSKKAEAPVPPVLGRIVCPPTPKPKPTATPEMGEPTMGKPAIPKRK